MDQSLQNNFLIATPKLDGTFFEKSVIYMCEHTSEGAMGVMINYPIEKHRQTILEQLNITSSRIASTLHLYLGGPVQTQHGLILHTTTNDQQEDSIQLSADISISASINLLTQSKTNRDNKHILFALGHAGWESGQIEQEMMDDAWLYAYYQQDIMFEVDPEKKWQQALKSIGITDVSKLSGLTGHA